MNIDETIIDLNESKENSRDDDKINLTSIYA